ncbi:MAG TPA: amino acid ABC transporter substrate-binding protein [Aliidongia sp.]|nr:amino acid ABC transporter substrate-binding protein [Aliidongia sp.]
MKGLIALAAVLTALAISSARAEDTDGAAASPPPVDDEAIPAVLTGTLKKVEDSGVVTLGYRDASFPFSYVRKDQLAPLGYSIDLCRGLVEEIVRELHGAPIRTEYRLVTSDTRMEAVTSGKIDLECGSTSSNTERQKSVAFSPVMFVAGTKLMVKRRSGIASYKDLGGKTLVVTSGTTNEKAMTLLDEKYHLGIKIVSMPDHEASYALLEQGGADAFATDDVLLSGFIAAKHSQDTMAVVGDFITYEAYGIMFRKDDPELAAAVRQAFSHMAADRSLVATYRKWFLQPTPTGEMLDLPISLQLSEAFRVLGLDDF